MLEPMRGVGRLPQTEVVVTGPRALDRAIADLAARQHGVAATRQLVALGFTQQAVSKRVASGRLHAVHRGVYAVGHPVLTRHGRWMAAVLAGGPGAALSHHAAAALWELRRGDVATIDVTVRRSGRETRAGLRLHRPRTLGSDEVTTKDRVPVTTPARTILDLAAHLGASRLEHVLDQAEIQELTDYPALDALARAHPGHHGAGRLRAALARHHAGTDISRSDLEIRFKDLCRNHGLPAPRINQRIEGKEVDFLFAEHALIVETDSWRYHKTRRAFEGDRARDARLAAAGYRTLRFTDRQLQREPTTVAALIATVLADRRAA